MASISRVPTEILSEIFYLLCEQPIVVSELNNSYYKDVFPWAVGLVCREWRTAFLSHPPIWASLKLSTNSAYPPRREDRGASYATEVKRRIALYLERSGGYHLRLTICVYNSHLSTFSVIASEMLSACSQRLRTARFSLCGIWLAESMLACKNKLPNLEWLEFYCFGRFPDISEIAPRLTHLSIAPWSNNRGWTLPWTQLTRLSLALDGDLTLKHDDVPKILPILHNIKDLRLRLDHCYQDFKNGFFQSAPTSLKQLCVLGVPHPAILSWFEAPSLRDIYFRDYQQSRNEPLDVHEELCSLIKRSGCKIRKLSFISTRNFHFGTLADVEELEIDYSCSKKNGTFIDISPLPELRLLSIVCLKDRKSKPLLRSFTTALKSTGVPMRRTRFPSTPRANCMLECVVVEFCYSRAQPKIPKRALELADQWPMVVLRTLPERSLMFLR